jgi:hypothetical protein
MVKYKRSSCLHSCSVAGRTLTYGRMVPCELARTRTFNAIHNKISRWCEWDKVSASSPSEGDGTCYLTLTSGEAGRSSQHSRSTPPRYK